MRIFIDMDDTLCDYQSAYERLRHTTDYPQSVDGFWLSLEPLSLAIETMHWLAELPAISVYILTAPSVHNPNCYTEKRLWVEKHLSIDWAHRLIISTDKGLLRGDLLIDDYIDGRGQENFQGLIWQFGKSPYQDWQAVRPELEHFLSLDWNTI